MVRMDHVSIYALCDPGGEIRYVGKTMQPVSNRLSMHVAEAKNPRYQCHRLNWIRSLLDQGARPEAVLLMKVPVAEWELWECT
jgi:hypothetical protein